MQIAAYLMNGEPPQQIAEKFIKQLLRNSYVKKSLCFESVAQFSESVFIFIGFQCEIKSSQIKENAYEWPLSLPVYTFPYNPLFFKRLGAFLQYISAVIIELQQATNCSRHESLRQSPIECFLQFLGAWHDIYNDLEQREVNFARRHFEEPLAVINFHLLLGFHPLWKTYRNDFRQLDDICGIFYQSALKGIFYPECHSQIAEGLSIIFSQDFQLFYEHDQSSLNLFLEILSVENHVSTKTKIFNLLEEMLQNPGITQSHLLILTNYLIEEKLQEAYFTIFKFTKSKRLLIATLQFLKILQSKLPSMDCFSRSFIESFWTHILHSDDTVSHLATKVYIKIMKRKFDQISLIEHILESYFLASDRIDMIDRYLKALWNVFPSLLDIDKYTEKIKSTHAPDSFRAYVAYCFVYVFEALVQDFGKFQFILEKLLLSLPNALKEINCEIILGIMLRIYTVPNFIVIRRRCSRYIEIFLGFEKFAFEIFTNYSYEYPTMWNLFGAWNYCLQFTKNWYKLERCSVIINNFLRNIEHELDKEDLPVPVLRQYNDYLQKFSILLKTGYDLCDNLNDFIQRIQIRLTDKSQMTTFATAANCLHDVYAIEILISGFKMQISSNDFSAHDKSISTRAQQLVEYLLTFLSNTEDVSKMSLMRINTIFGCFIDLHCIFHNKCTIHNIKLSPHTYSVLVEILIFINFNTKTANTSNEKLQLHPDRIFEYQKLLLQKFVKLHGSHNVTIPSNVAWKLCICYKLNNHGFDRCLEDLLHVIAVNHFQKFRHIIPVLIYNLYNRQPPLKDITIIQILDAHKSFIDGHILKDAEILKVHIILTVLQIIGKSLKLLPPNSSGNRLAALEHLYVLCEGIKWNDKSVLDIIVIHANKLTVNIINPEERKSFNTFLHYFNKLRNS